MQRFSTDAAFYHTPIRPWGHIHHITEYLPEKLYILITHIVRNVGYFFVGLSKETTALLYAHLLQIFLEADTHILTEAHTDIGQRKIHFLAQSP